MFEQTFWLVLHCLKTPHKPKCIKTILYNKATGGIKFNLLFLVNCKGKIYVPVQQHYHQL